MPLRSFPCFLVLVLSVLSSILGVAPVGARTLTWDTLDIEARLDADGALHVVERQAMVFDGAWNGGERTFDVDFGKRVTLEGFDRIDDTGHRSAMIEGDLDRIDGYDWVDGKTLRWRSRLPDDPPFAATALTYELRYVLRGILVRRDPSLYRLDHDFGMPNRRGEVRHFGLRFALDPVWSYDGDLPTRVDDVPLGLGSGYRVFADLRHTAAEPPAQAQAPVSLWWRIGAFVLSALGMVAVLVRFVRHESARGRFDGRPAVSIDRAFLEQHLFDLLPEEVGALWDQSVGPPEVGAVLARMVAEGKLASKVLPPNDERKKQELELVLRIDREQLRGYERKLIDKLFFDNRTEVDTAAIRKHYKKRGFDPASTIRKLIQRNLKRHRSLEKAPVKPSGKPFGLAVLFIVAMLAIEALTQGLGGLIVAPVLLFMTPIPATLGCVVAFLYRRSSSHPIFVSLFFLVPAGLLWLLTFATASSSSLTRLGLLPVFPGVAGIAAFAAWPVAMLMLWTWVAATRDSAKTIRKRQLLAAIRRRFQQELKHEHPALEDDWFPYLLAFGLDKKVSRWFREFGGEQRNQLFHGTSVGSMSSSIGTPRFTGGGGAFGGGGASAAWATAVGGIAAGVARPSSGGSSGGGYSGGGSSFSGGGGGGGW